MFLTGVLHQSQLSKTDTNHPASSTRLQQPTACAGAAYPPLTYNAFPPVPMSASDAGAPPRQPLPPQHHHHLHAATMAPPAFPPPRPTAPVPSSHKFASVADWLLPPRKTSRSDETTEDSSGDEHEPRDTGRTLFVIPPTRQTVVDTSPVESRGPSRLHSATGMPSTALLLGIWPQRGRPANSAASSQAGAAAAAAAKAVLDGREASSSLAEDMDLVRSLSGAIVSENEDTSWREGGRRSVPSGSQVGELGSCTSVQHLRGGALEALHQTDLSRMLDASANACCFSMWYNVCQC